MSQKVKRIADVALSLLGLVLLSPLLVLIASVILLTMGRPVLFQQRRIGRWERPFVLLKFRTMREAADDGGRPLPDHVRLTRTGAFLRRTSLDELPQLWNVIKGDLSLVGPRPLLTRHLPYFAPGERVRFQVWPGITGWAQVHGRNRTAWDRRFAADVWYVEHWSLWLDVKILALTMIRLLTAYDGAVVPPPTLLDLEQERKGHEGAYHET